MYVLRSAGPGDEALLFEVYAATRKAELDLTDWDAAQREAFCRQQFLAQDRWYHEQYAGASFDVVLVGGVPVGRLYVDRWPAEIRIVDIALLPASCGRGIGGAVLADVLAEADAAGLATSVHVERFNPARRLYERLGFGPVAENGPYLLLERPCAAARTPTDSSVQPAV